MKLRNKSHSVGACWFAATCALGIFFAQERSASALGLDTGIEGGVATRSSYSWGPFFGAHLELRPFKGLRVGAYVTDTLQNATDGREAKEYISHVSVGGRVRYLFDFNEKLHAFGAVGIGYVYSEFPAYEVPAQPIVNPTVSQQQLGRLDVRDGNFMEVPVTAGVAYSAFSHTNFSLNLAWRPGFSFKGEAYEGEGSYARPTQGFSASLGMSFFF